MEPWKSPSEDAYSPEDWAHLRLLLSGATPVLTLGSVGHSCCCPSIIPRSSGKAWMSFSLVTVGVWIITSELPSSLPVLLSVCPQFFTPVLFVPPDVHSQSCFLCVPRCSLQSCFLCPQICTAEVEVLMTRLQNTFRQELSGVGASLEKRWKFCGFDGLKMT